MKKVLLLLAVMLGGLGSVSASTTEESVPFSPFGWGNSMTSLTSYKISFTNQWGSFYVTKTSFNSSTYPKYKLYYHDCSGSVQFKITTAGVDSYIPLSTSNTEYEGTFGSGEITSIVLQETADGGGSSIVVDKFCLIDGDGNETVMTDGATWWGLTYAVYGGTINITGNWSGFGLPVADYTAYDQVTYKITFGSATTKKLTVKAVYQDAQVVYSDLNAGTTEFTFTAVKPLTSLEFQDGTGESEPSTYTISSVKRTTTTNQVISQETISTTEFELSDNWSTSQEITAAQLTNACLGDAIRVTYSGATSGESQIGLKYSDWSDISNSAMTLYTGTVVYYLLSDADVLNSIKTNGLRIGGKSCTITGVYLEKTENSVYSIAFPAGKDYVSFCSSSALDFTGIDGLTAYVVSEVGASTATLTEVTQVPAGTGLILKGTAGTTYQVPVIATADAIATNYLKAAINDVDVEANSTYVLSDGQFKTFTGTTIPAGKAYLNISGAARDLDLNFGGETTGINEELRMKNEESVYYNIAGQRVAQPTKGLYIVNGKKVIIK